MGRKHSTTEDWQKIKQMVKEGKTSSQIGLALGYSKSTIDKWRQRQHHGIVPNAVGRPPKGALGSFSVGLRDQIKKWRQDYEKRGSKTMLSDLKKDGGWAVDDLPSQKSIDRFLSEQRLSKSYDRHIDLNEFKPLKAHLAHERWQLDGRGNEWVEGVGVVSLLDVKDVASCLYAGLYPALMSSRHSHPSTSHYQTAVRLAAMMHGLPRQIQTDRASVFFDNNSKSPFPTLFFLWLLALGVEPVLSQAHTPQDQGHVERSHRTVWAQVDRKSPYRNWEHFFLACQQRCRHLNECLPCASLKNLPPLTACPEARHSGTRYHYEQEQKLLNMDRVFDYLQQGQWERRVSKAQTICLGNQVYYLPNAIPNSSASIQFRKSDQCLLFQIHNQICLKIPIKGCNINDLMGPDLLPMPGVQLQLPFADENSLILIQLQNDTTF
jgi:transposase InsO family protein